MSGPSPSESSVQANMNEKREARDAREARERMEKKTEYIIIKSNENESRKHFANALIY